MLLNFGQLSIWSGTIPISKKLYLPRITYFNGGSYWKVGFRWFKYLLELSGSKTNSTSYKRVTSKELDIIIKKINK